jgi:hypothetical protein
MRSALLAVLALLVPAPLAAAPFAATPCAPAPLAPASLAAAPLSPAPFDQPDVAFKEKLKKAVAAGKKDVEKLVANDTPQAAAWIVRLTEVLAERDDPNEKPLHAALVEGWNASVKTAFPERFAAYLQGRDDAQRKTRADLKKRLERALNDLEVNREARDGLVFVQTADELDLLAGAFDSEGDDYSASEALLALAELYDEPLRGTDADPHKAWKLWTRAAEFRAKVELADERADAARARAAELAQRGYDKEGGAVDAPEKGGEGGKGGAAPSEPAGPPQETGNPIAIALKFEALPSPEAYARPCYQADEVYPTWNPISLGAKGSSGTFSLLGNLSPVLHRVGSADLRFDVDGDGRGDGAADQKISISGALTPYPVQIGKGDEARPWAFFAVAGVDKDTFQGIEVNLQPTDENYNLYTLSAASVVGLLGTTPIRVIDDSMDGVYGGEVLTYAYGGLAPGSYQPDLDSIVIGTSKRARPWSQYQEIGGQWWKLSGGSKGQELLATPASVATGTLKLEAKGVAPAWVVVRGADELKDCFFDLVEGGAKGVRVPAGRYTLFYGEVRKGKKRQMIKSLILPGRSAPNYDVRAGQTVVVNLGAPYSFEWNSTRSEDSVTVQGATVTVVGIGGERYERTWNCVTRPEVSWRKKGAKKAGGTVRMDLISDQEKLYARGNQGWIDVWYPLDLVLETKGAGDVELQMSDAKHKLFGKVESPWKE